MNTQKKTVSIRVLPRDVSEKIAAGEVIERPLSVVKELVENSIDAGSSSISVEIEEGGNRLIRIIDDGCGMTEDELGLAVLRFATSKIQSFEDLESLHTLGFRGEALPSIAAVSTMEIVSRPPEAFSGHKLVIEGGKILELKEAASEKGTYITIRDLFYNTPARKKFLKSPISEAAQISHFLSKIVLANRNVHFKLKSNQKSVLNFPLQLSLKECLMRLWQCEDENDIFSLSETVNGITVEGYLCHPRITRGNRNEQYIFVNRRLIKNTMLAQAIQDGFQPFLTPRRHPLVLLFLQVPPDEVDANVHPTKTEIRFANGNGIFSLVKNSIAKAVREFQVPVYSYAREEKSDTSGGGEVYETPLLYDMSTGEVIEERRQTGPSLFPPEQSSRYQERSSRYLAEAEPLREGSPAETSRQTSFLPLAQLFDTYIIGEMKGELWIADQHASHERVVYDRLLKPSGEQGKAAQTLLISEVMEFSPSESLLLSEHIQTFNDMGFSLEHFGGNSFVLRSLPPFIEPGQAGELIRSILADISQGAGGKGKEGHDLFDGLRKIISCRGSVQAGQRMTPEEMKRLIYDLLNCGDPWHCPHGRPTMVKLGKLDLEKMFKRK